MATIGTADAGKTVAEDPTLQKTLHPLLHHRAQGSMVLLIEIYTGNDDNIVMDLLTEYRFSGTAVRMVGGLLGQWAVWTSKAVQLLEAIHELAGRQEVPSIPSRFLTLNAEVTDANAALFDARHDFAGCIAGIHEILRRQGLLEGRWCINPQANLSPGQGEEIDRVCAAYPHLQDDDFVRQHLDEWLK